MPDSAFDACLKFVLQFEGGFVNDPRDPGGATNLGVTIGTLSRFLGRPATVAEVKKLSPRSVAPIYKKMFWDEVQAGAIPAGVDLAVFDFAVHSGPVRAAIALQRVCGVADDGNPGPITLAAVKRGDPSLIVQRLCAERLAFLSRLSVFKSFGRGLRNRVSKCESAALLMVSNDIGRAVADAEEITEALAAA